MESGSGVSFVDASPSVLHWGADELGALVRARPGVLRTGGLAFWITHTRGRNLET